MKCTLDKDINTCNHYDPITEECSNPNKCSFQDRIDTSKVTLSYERKERWYEKYYRR